MRSSALPDSNMAGSTFSATLKSSLSGKENKNKIRISQMFECSKGCLIICFPNLTFLFTFQVRQLYGNRGINILQPIRSKGKLICTCCCLSVHVANYLSNRVSQKGWLFTHLFRIILPILVLSISLPPALPLTLP